jgi:hypothetical protein
MFIIYLHTEFKMLSSGSSLIFFTNQKPKIFFRKITMLFCKNVLFT